MADDDDFDRVDEPSQPGNKRYREKTMTETQTLSICRKQTAVDTEGGKKRKSAPSSALITRLSSAVDGQVDALEREQQLLAGIDDEATRPREPSEANDAASDASEDRVPCLPPSTRRTELYLRSLAPNVPSSEWCYLCDTKDTEQITILREFIESQRGVKEDKSIALEVSRRYETEIRAELKRHLDVRVDMSPQERARAELPPWPPISVWRHLQEHDTSAVRSTMANDVAALAMHLKRNGLYVRRHGAETVFENQLREEDCEIDPKKQACFERLIKIYDSLTKSGTPSATGRGTAAGGKSAGATQSSKQAMAGGSLLNIGAAKTGGKAAPTTGKAEFL